MPVLAIRLGHNVGQLFRSRQERRAFDRIGNVDARFRCKFDRRYFSTYCARFPRSQRTGRHVSRKDLFPQYLCNYA